MELYNLILDAFKYIQAHPGSFSSAVRLHLVMSILAVSAAMIIGVPLGYWGSRSPFVAQLFTSAFGTIRVIPGLAILALVIPLLGSGPIPASLALMFLALPSILLNTIAGFQQADPETLEAARGIGMSLLRTLVQVEFPLAMPSILNGIRVSLVEVISAAALAAFVGGGGLGSFIVNGLSMYELPLLLVGALPVAAMAVCIELFFGLTLRRINRYRTC